MFRHKTVKALIGHILRTIPGPGDGYCEPLATHYIRALHTVLEYQPHTEHLKGEDWLVLVRFCNDGIQALSEPLEEADSNDLVILDSSDRRLYQDSRSATPNSIGGSAISVRKPVTRNISNNTDRQTADELIQCLSQLFMVPHAQTFEVTEITLSTLLEFLGTTYPLSRTQSQEAVFLCINIILRTTITEDLAIATRIVKEAIHQIRRLWQPKTHHSLKKEMILTVVKGEPLLPKVLGTDPDFKNELERLLDVLQGEYTKRAERELLQSDDLLFDSVTPRSPENPLSNQVFRLQSGNRGSEQSWATLWSVAMVFMHLKDYYVIEASSRKENIEMPKKRRKISSPITALIDAVSTSAGLEKMATLQIVAFVSLETSFHVDDLASLFGLLIPFISNEVSSIAIWAMLTLSW